jgi:hypothetical protein
MIPVPHIDPIAAPGPLWLLRTLLLLTFFLHLLFMNTLLGGAVVAFVCGLQQKRSEFAAQLGRELGRVLPVVFAFTITLGVAPLLFLQVIYGHLLYASSILMAVPWLGIIALVLWAYYGVYYFSLRGTSYPASTVAVLGVAALLLAGVAHIYTNNFTLMLTPERWLSLYGQHPSGWTMNWADATVFPRYLHFVLGALAVAGLYLVLKGLRQHETMYGRWLIERGAQLFVAPTVLNYLVGFWFLLRLPDDVRMTFLGRNGLATALLGIGMLLPLAAMVHLTLARSNKSPVRQAVIGICSGVLTVAIMVVMRDILRNAYLAPIFRPERLQVAPQWGVIGLFLVVFLAGLATLFYMLRALARAPKAASAAAAGFGK